MKKAELQMRLEKAEAAWRTAWRTSRDAARAATSWAVAEAAWSDERVAREKLDAAEDALAASCLEGER